MSITMTFGTFAKWVECAEETGAWAELAPEFARLWTNPNARQALGGVKLTENTRCGIDPELVFVGRVALSKRFLPARVITLYARNEDLKGMQDGVSTRSTGVDKMVDSL